MSTNYWFKSLYVSHYRGLEQLKIARFRRVNVIGGLNGSGKTTVLEALFALADWKSPVAILKHSMWRQLPPTIESTSSYTFTNGDRQQPIRVAAKTREGEWSLEARYEPQPSPPVQQISTTEPNMPAKQSVGTISGITLKICKDGDLLDVSHLTDAGEGIQIIREKASQLAWPTCTLLTKATLGNPQDNSARYTFAVQNKNKARVLSIVRLAIPWLRDLQLLQMGGTTHLCGEITEDVFVPVSLLGDGALTLASVGLSIIQCRNGAVLLDEFDTAIHYTRLKTVWAEIAGLANEFNCQVFAATHSRECIAAAAAGLSDAQLADDLQYIRLDRLDDGGTVCTAYSSHELNNALEEDWEVR